MANAANSSRPIRVAFIHPDLGIGGAERLVVDAALGLQRLKRSAADADASRGDNATPKYEVVIFTSHHDPKHCFEETKGELKVVVRGDWLPLTLVAGKGHILCAMLRNIYVALSIMCENEHWDAFIVDQLSICVPLLRLKNAKILFYCHFPDLLLTTRRSLLKWLYRLLPDFLEEITTGMADSIMVNSRFTAGVFAATFKRLAARGVQPIVRYPAIQTASPAQKPAVAAVSASRGDKSGNRVTFLSINRYERKKNIGLAIRALASLRGQLPAELFQRVRLVVAGGYDERVLENKEHYRELKDLAHSDECRLTTADDPQDEKAQVVFVRSFSNAQKQQLLADCSAVVYTPSNEHFGIVPVEAMYAYRPVIAVASGGPCESVVPQRTGWLCEPEPAAFASAMRQLIENPKLVDTLGTAGHARVLELFTLEAFAKHLDEIVTATLRKPPSHSRHRLVLLAAIIVAVVLSLFVLRLGLPATAALTGMFGVAALFL